MMNPTPPLGPKQPRRAAGFSLVEILLSLGIFAIGMTAIVSLFPAAAILQRETTQEVISDMAAESARSIMNAQALEYTPGSPGSGELAAYYSFAGPNLTDAVPLYTVSANLVNNRYSPADRSYPTGLIDRTATTDFEAVAGCDLHWVPFIQDLNGDPNGPNWIVRLFILESDSRATYTGVAASDANPADPDNIPKVRSLNVNGVNANVFTLGGVADLEQGDVVMDSNGNDYVITAVDATNNQVTVINSIPLSPGVPGRLWYTPRLGGTNSPAQRVVTIEVTVVD